MRGIYQTVLVILAAYGAQALAGGRVGNGGDSMRLIFARAKEHASVIVMKVKANNLPPHTRADVREFILKNRESLAGDIVATPHEWSESVEATCALTDVPNLGDPVPSGTKIQFSYPTCARSVENFGGVTEVLVHESVHHFGIGEEEFADAVANAIRSAWQNGSLEWSPIAAEPAPSARELHAAAWTGEYMLIHGGLVQTQLSSNTNRPRSLQPGEGYTNSFFKYDPKSGVWTELSRIGSPTRAGHDAVWLPGVGKLVVWGGFGGLGPNFGWQNNGAIWDQATNTWSELKTPYGSAVTDHYVTDIKQQRAVAADDKVMIWGGRALSDGNGIGGIYDAKAKTWTAIPATGGAPLVQGGHSAVWADGKLLVWGGKDFAQNNVGTGAAFDPLTQRWSPLGSMRAPRARYGHTAVWTGQVMVVFSGFESTNSLKGSGGVYDPSQDTWTQTTTEVAMERRGHTAVWTGQDMLVWGGKSKRLLTFFNDVVGFNPSDNRWKATSAGLTPLPRHNHSAVWTGSSMIVWGGSDESGILRADGGIYYP